MELTINGEKQTHPAGLTMAALLELLDMEPTLVAVEVNCQLVPRSQHSQTTLHDGDVLEIVSLAGGG
ncbi:MAG: thiamine biosynthesis protein ThiS [Planctomycetota bacterium]|nr:MAG: thiamine biosynthesis protein ThiS [Planctomycetota bacterium]